MPVLSLKPTHKAIVAYYESLATFDRLGIKHEGAVRSAFQTPHRAVLYQGGERLHDADLTRPDELVHVLDLFFAYRPAVIAEWEKAAEEFKERVPELGKNLANLITKERQSNAKFKAAFVDFLAVCCASLNLNLAE